MRNVVFRGASLPLGGHSLGGNCAGYTYTCSTCGDQWGRVEISDKGTWINSTWPCEAHGNAANRGGSFLSRLIWGDFAGAASLRTTLDRVSPELLLHEVKMAINQTLGESYA